MLWVCEQQNEHLGRLKDPGAGLFGACGGPCECCGQGGLPSCVLLCKQRLVLIREQPLLLRLRRLRLLFSPAVKR